MANSEFAARVRLGATDTEQVNVAAAIEGSIVDEVLAAKLVVYYDDDPGYFDNINQELPPPNAPHPLQPFYVKPADGSDVGALETTMIRPTRVRSRSSRPPQMKPALPKSTGRR
jgi:hypothetical protein